MSLLDKLFDAVSDALGGSQDTLSPNTAPQANKAVEAPQADTAAPAGGESADAKTTNTATTAPTTADGATDGGPAGANAPATAPAPAVDESTASWESVLSGSVVLKRDAKSPAVKTMQEKLTAAGHGVAKTGEFGPTTEGVVKAFQGTWGIQQNGMMGAQTANALEEVVEWKQILGGQLVLRKGDSRPGVSFVQRAFKKLGKNIAHTGTFDDAMYAIVVEFQKANGLGRDGAIGKNTAGAIQSGVYGGGEGGAGAPYQGGANWLGTFQITHYTYAREDDPIHANSPKVSAPGLSEKYRASFLGTKYGVGMQGTGLAENGKYIRWAGGGRYAYGVGGAYAKVDRPYQQIAIDPTVIRKNAAVVVEPYRDKGLMTADDCGGAIKGKHIDVFVGPVTIKVAYALGTKYGRVGYPTESAAPKPAEPATGETKAPEIALSPGPTPWINRAEGAGNAPASGNEPVEDPNTPAPSVEEPAAGGGGAPAPETPTNKPEEPATKPQEPATDPNAGATKPPASSTEPTTGKPEEKPAAVGKEEAPSANWQKVMAGELLLKKGMKGAIIEELQRRLNDAGFKCGVDGDFGNNTASAVRQVQNATGAKPDGVVGKDTAAAISQTTAWEAVLNGSLVLELGMKGPAVKHLQMLLTRAGHGVGATAEYGNQTKQMVEEFQAKNEIQVTSKVGKTTATILEQKATGGNGGFIWPLRGGKY
ncbi:MAG: peptidoglycan-binding protein, partial [Myxococcota bacterium]|nr:peptidoglycan-binding protein [Myxococcota bacterium]